MHRASAPYARSADDVFFARCGAKRYHVVPLITAYQFGGCYHILDI